MSAPDPWADRSSLADLETPIGAEPWGEPPDEDRAAEDLRSWRPVDISTIVDQVDAGTYERTTPSMMWAHGPDGQRQALLYPGLVHALIGPSNSGKTYAAACALAEVMMAGDAAGLIDFEDVPSTIIERLLLDLRVPADVIKERFVYIRPLTSSKDGIAEARQAMRARGVRLVVVDSTGEALANDNVKPNEDDEVARWMRRVARALADDGAAVLLIDHVPKDDDKALKPIGSHRKISGLDGALYSVQVITAFSKTTPGRVKIVCGKDRQGTYAKGHPVAEFVVTPVPGEGRTDVRLVTPTEPVDKSSSAWRPTHLMEKISRIVEDALAGPLSQRAIVEAARGNKDTVKQALAFLVLDGFVSTSPGPNRSILHESVKPYREPVVGGGSTDPVSEAVGEPEDPWVPTHGSTGSTATGAPRVHSGPPGSTGSTAADDRPQPCPECGHIFHAHWCSRVTRGATA